MKNYINQSFYAVNNHNMFMQGIDNALVQLNLHYGVFCGDNLISINRNLSFLDEKKFVESFDQNTQTNHEKSVIWRVAVVLWGFRNGLRLQGDFVECACYKGATAKTICDSTEFQRIKDRKYFLYDLFEHDDSDPHHGMPAHGGGLYEEVRKKFVDFPNVIVTQGRVPEVLDQVSPQKIAFLHLDLNNVDAEIGALEVLFDRMVPGAVMVLDDYGWLAYREQKLAEDEWLGKRGYRVLELPTGQGLVIK